MLKQLKKWTAICMCIALLMVIPCKVEAAVANPLKLSVIEDAVGAAEFTAVVQAADAFSFGAFDFVIEYDPAVLEVDNMQGIGYDYTDEFKGAYKGMLACNDRDAYSHVSFAGAMTGAPLYQGTMAQVHFKVKPESFATSTVLSLRVNVVGTETAAGVETLQLENKMQAYTILIKAATGLEGDVNNDGKITLVDAQMALRAALHLLALPQLEAQQADVDKDSKISMTDARIILRKALHLE